MTTTMSIFNLMDAQVLADPYPFYDLLRKYDPVYWDDYFKGWVFTSFEGVQAALRSPKISNHRIVTIEELEMLGLAELAPLYFPLTNQLLFIDPPKHTRLRNLMANVFTPRKVEKMRSYLQSLVDQMLEEVIDKGSMDIIAQIAYPLPLTVIAELLGVPIEDREQLKKWSDHYADMLGSFQCIPDNPEEALQSLHEMTEYFLAIIQEYRKKPGDNLLSGLIQVQEQGSHLDNDELMANCILLLAAAHETTTNLIGNGMLTLLQHQDQLALLRQNPSLISNAVEEMLRFESPAQYTVRKANDDVELGGKTLKKGQVLILLLGAANRDPERFNDPARFDIQRQDNRHMAFGHGSHFCFGAPLARLEAQLAIITMLDRLPNLRLESTQLVWRENKNLRGLATLPVVFDRL